MNHLFHAPGHRVSSLNGRSLTAKFVLTVLTLFLGFNFQSHAIVNSHQWVNDYTGYSIEQVPGTGVGGVAEEFMAVGTSRNTNHGSYGGYYGFHVMRLDANGAVLNSREVWITIQMPWLFGIDYEAVDITPEFDQGGSFTNHFWIVAQARQYFAAGSEEDYIYCHKVKTDCTDPTTVQAFYIRSANAQEWDKNLYPTNSICYNGALYICGYAAENGTVYPSYPMHTTGDKIGMIVKYDLSSTATTHYFWNTGSTGTDYDMALRLRMDAGRAGEILMTGAINSDMNASCGILVARFDANLNFTGFNGIMPSAFQVYSEPPPTEGVYGIDIYEDAHNDVYVLCNVFNGNTNYKWGILKLTGNMRPYAGPTNSFAVTTNTHDAWAKHFFYEEHGADHLVTFRVVGEQADVFCNSTATDITNNHPTSQQPSYTNVNPFIEDFTVGWNASGITHNVNWHTVHLSANGTGNYYSGYPTYNPPPAGASLQNEERLYTAALQLNENPAQDIIILAPVSNGVMGWAGTKFLRTDNNGDESVCQNQVGDCITLEAMDAYAVGIFESSAYEGIRVTNYEPYDEYNPTATEYNCSTGYYKQSTSLLKVTNTAEDITLYPNPASNALNIRLEKPVGINGKFAFALVDMTGRQVYKLSNADPLDKEIKINLPALAPGVYIANIKVNQTSTTKRVVIQQ